MIEFCCVLATLIAIALYAMHRAEYRAIEQYGIRSIPPEIFQWVWDESSTLLEIYYDAMKQRDSQVARTAIYELGDRLADRRYLHYMPPIVERASALIDIQRSHPGLLAKWTREADVPVQYHPAVLITAATMPLPELRFDRSGFFALVQQTAQQIETGETAP